MRTLDSMSWLSLAKNSLANLTIGKMMSDPEEMAVVSEESALVGSSTPLTVGTVHRVLKSSMVPPFPEGAEKIVLAMGCFWGAEEIFWELPGVTTTAAGYAGGFTANPTYPQVCSGKTGHAESVLVVWDPARVSLKEILKCFWENHDPTQFMRQGNDVGSQYRSAIFADSPSQLQAAKLSKDHYQTALDEAGRGQISTEIELLSEAGSGKFYYAEDMHQQYLYKNPNGYRCHARTGVACPV